MANEQQPEQQLSAHGAARRRFNRAGAAASGVLLTLHSQPGMAQTVCAGASGFQSGLVSARPNDPGNCNGASPGMWKNTEPADIDDGKGKGKKGGGAQNPPNPDKVWPSGAKPGDPFSSVFFCPSHMLNTYGAPTCTLDWIMGNGPDFDTHKLGAHLVAAYLNVLSGRSSFQTVPMIKAMWNELLNPGFYSPTAGVQWDAPKVVDYLKRTMG